MCSICDCAFVGLGCCGACAAAIFLVVFYFLFGIIFISIASTAKASVALYQDLLTYDVSLFPNLCIVIGILFTLLTFLGLLGESKGRKTRIVYATVQVVVVALGLYIYIDAYPNESKLDGTLFDSLNSSAYKYASGYYHHGVANLSQNWDEMQETLECCGVDNYQDWRTIYGQDNDKPPISCCLEEHRMLHCSNSVDYENPAESSKIIFVKGCLPKIRSTILDSMRILHWFLIPILVIVSLEGIVSCCSGGMNEDTEMIETKMGPIIVRTKSREAKRASYQDVEADEKNDQSSIDKVEDDKEVEMQALNPAGHENSANKGLIKNEIP